MAEIIKKYVTCYVSGNDDTKPIQSDEGKHYAVRTLDKGIASASGLEVSELPTEGTPYLGVLTSEPSQVIVGNFYWDTTQDSFMIYDGGGFDEMTSADSTTYDIAFNTDSTAIWRSGIINAFIAGTLDTQVIDDGREYIYYDPNSQRVLVITRYGRTSASINSDDADDIDEYLGELSAEPAFLSDGNWYFDTDDDLFYILDSSMFVEADNTTNTISSTIKIAVDTDNDHAWANADAVITAFNDGDLTLSGSETIVYYDEADSDVVQVSEFTTTTASIDSIDITASDITPYKGELAAEPPANITVTTPSVTGAYKGSLATAPATGAVGDWYYDTADDQFKVYVGTAFRTALSTDTVTVTAGVTGRFAIQSAADHSWGTLGAFRTAVFDSTHSLSLSNINATNLYILAAGAGDGVRTTNVYVPPGVAGDYYFNSTDNLWKIFSGTAFRTATRADSVLSGSIQTAPFVIDSATDHVIAGTTTVLAQIADGTITDATGSGYLAKTTTAVTLYYSYNPSRPTLTTQVVADGTSNFIGASSAEPIIPAVGDFFWDDTQEQFLLAVTGPTFRRVTATDVLAGIYRTARTGEGDEYWQTTDVIAAFASGTLTTSTFTNNQRYIYWDENDSETRIILGYTAPVVNSVTSSVLSTTTEDAFLGVLSQAPTVLVGNQFYWHDTDDKFIYYKGTDSTAVGTVSSTEITASVGSTGYLGQHATDAAAVTYKTSAATAGNWYWDTTNDVFRGYETAWANVDHRGSVFTGAGSIYYPSTTENKWANLAAVATAINNQERGWPPANYGGGNDIVYNDDDDKVYDITGYTEGATTTSYAFADFPLDSAVGDYTLAVLNVPATTAGALDSVDVAASNAGYLGAHASDTDANTAASGATGVANDWYFSTTDDKFRVWDASASPAAWKEVANRNDIPGDVQIASNDNDIHSFADESTFLSDRDMLIDFGQTTNSYVYLRDPGKTIDVTNAYAEVAATITTTDVTAGASGYLGPRANDAAANTAAAGATGADNDWYYDTTANQFKYWRTTGTPAWVVDNTGQSLPGDSQLYTNSDSTHEFANLNRLTNKVHDEHIRNSGSLANTTNAYAFLADSNKAVSIDAYVANVQTTSWENEDEVLMALDDSTLSLDASTEVYYDEALSRVNQIGSYISSGDEIAVNLNPAVAKTSSVNHVIYGKLISISPDGITCRIAITGQSIAFAGTGDGTLIGGSSATATSVDVVGGNFNGESTSDPTGGSYISGQSYYYNTADQRFKRYDGTNWVTFTSSTESRNKISSVSDAHVLFGNDDTGRFSSAIAAFDAGYADTGYLLSDAISGTILSNIIALYYNTANSRVEAITGYAVTESTTKVGRGIKATAEVGKVEIGTGTFSPLERGIVVSGDDATLLVDM